MKRRVSKVYAIELWDEICPQILKVFSSMRLARLYQSKYYGKYESDFFSIRELEFVEEVKEE